MSSLPEHIASLLAYALAPLLTLLGSSAGTADLVAAATAAAAALLLAAAATRLVATPRTATAGPAATSPVHWHERAHRLHVPRTCDPDAPGRQRPRAPSAPLPVA